MITIYNGLHMSCGTGVIAAFLCMIAVFVGCIARIIRAAAVPAVIISSCTIFGLAGAYRFAVHRHDRGHGRPGPGPVGTAAVPAGFTGAAGAGVIGKAGIIRPPVGAVGKGAGDAAQSAEAITAAAAGIAPAPAGRAAVIVIAAAAMVMAAGITAASAAAGGIICAIGLCITVIAARAAARTMFFHICHEEILLSSEASASRDTPHPMPD